MKRYIKHHPWNVIEDGFVPSNNRISESIFSLGNGRFGTRGNFEEDYSGDSLQGSYVAGIYYPDPTRVGWWKNGYPEYFAKVLNATNWIGIRVSIEEEILDIAKCTVIEFQRDLDMQTGLLNRTVQLRTEAGRELRIVAKRFCSMDNDELSIQSYSICPLNFEGEIKLLPFLDGDVVNEDSNYDVKFWEEIGKYKEGNCAILQTKTRKLDFVLTCGMVNQIYVNNDRQDMSFTYKEQDKFIGQSYSINVRSNDVLEIQKVCCIVSSENYALSEAKEHVLKTLKFSDSFQEFFERHADKWKEKWSFSDISIKGDIAAQQGIRFNIFQLFQTYTGADSRLNIGPKGFTGEKYGGCTYWDTEAYCINFYLSSAPQEVARNLLVYRHKQLGKAIENAEKLGFHSGAALFPMVTMNGEECHNEWEITFEEIHRNGAIAYAIYRYVNYTNDKLYLVQYGLEVLIAISRFWAQRVNWSDHRSKYVMLGVTGPNEYENNVNNNWYTNYIARWCLQYTLESIDWCLKNNERSWKRLETLLNFKTEEASKWLEIIEKMHLPEDERKGVFLQQDGFMDKLLEPVSSIPLNENPICQNWSWDRILRSCFIKQADVLQGLYFFREDFDQETIERNFEFYEPMTVHESSLSPCVHSILACHLGKKEKAYEMYIRTSRLDLDDYNNDTEDGLHITSMGGTWMSVVEGFGGMRVSREGLSFDPLLPDEWQELQFNILYQGQILTINIEPNKTSIRNLGDEQVQLWVEGRRVTCEPQVLLELDQKE